MTYSYRKANTSDKKVVFDLYCLIMSEFVTEIWGWNEEWQVEDFDNYFIPENITLVHKRNNLVGFSGSVTLRKFIVVSSSTLSHSFY